MNKKEILQSYISLPKNVSVYFGELVILKNNYKERLLIFSGPLGEVKLNLKKIDPLGLGRLKISEDKQKIFIYHRSKKDLKPLKTLIQGKIYGVTIGYLSSLRIIGVGYRVFLQQNKKRFKNLETFFPPKILIDQNRTPIPPLILISQNVTLPTATQVYKTSFDKPTATQARVKSSKLRLSKKETSFLERNEETTYPGLKSEISTVGEGELIFKMGYSHDIKYQLPESVRGFVLEPTLLCIYGIDKNQVAEIANKIRKIRPPENYKGKGIRFLDEKVTILQGKRK